MPAKRIGLYICHCGSNISARVDCEAVARYGATLPGVVISRDYKYICSDPGQELIKGDIREFELEAVVVASCSPRMHEPTFRRALAEGGLNPYLLEMANIREGVSWVTRDRSEATLKARALVRGAVERVRLHQPLQDSQVPGITDTLVVGGGIAGITAALKLAHAGVRVTLVEREPTIGGQMARLDKTFPTLDCSACILTPKMVEVAQHPLIELLTLAEVERVEGFIGNFAATIRLKPRSVNTKLCTGCGTCWEKCPKQVASEFELGLGSRKAIYIPFPQAVPNKPVIDRESCTYFATGKCKACQLLCPAKAVDFDQAERVVSRRFGAIILATGYETPDMTAELPQYGYGRLKGVITGLEFERLANASGPTEGRILTPDGRVPRRVAVLHCIGSRQEGRTYCSRICCMSALKTAHMIHDRTGAEVYEFYIDMRSFGKGYEEFYSQVRGEGIHLVRGKVAGVTEEQGSLVVQAEDTLRGVKVTVPVDLVILSTALVPRSDAGQVAVRFGITRGPEGFFTEEHPKLEPLKTATEGVFLAGACQGPKDIPDTVAQATGAATEVLARLSGGSVKVPATVAAVRAERCAGCRSCLSLCPYGAISFSEERKAAVTPAKCHGCGTCVASCPSGALVAYGFETDQILAQIGGVVAP